LTVTFLPRKDPPAEVVRIDKLSVKASVQKMSGRSYCSLHPDDRELPAEFLYGNMRVTRKPLEGNERAVRQSLTIFESCLRAGIFPHETRLTGDYLEHHLIRKETDPGHAAGRFLGLIMADGSYQYVRLDGESIGVNKRQMSKPDEITILTDTCLFCAASATALLESGDEISIVAPRTNLRSKVKELRIMDQLCPYETDAILRLTDLISAITEGNRSCRKAVLAMPTVEYYLYLMDAYNEGQVEKGLMQSWIDQVNRHAGMIVEALRERIDLETELCQPLQVIEPYLREQIDRDQKADFQKVTEILTAENTLWKQILPVTRPTRWPDLNYTNYIISILETSLVKDERHRLTIDIENPSEQRILRNAQKVSRTADLPGDDPRFRVIGIYPHEKIFVSAGTECSGLFPRLYYLDQGLSSEEDLYQQIIEANRAKVLY